jgi:hypothetical protein
VTKQISDSFRILIVLNILIITLGYILIRLFYPDFHLSDIIIPSLVFSFISVITILIFFRGQTRDPESQTFHSLVSLSLKLLLELMFALCWFIFAKKTSIEFILIFFVLYLCLSLFSIGVILKTLKNKDL